jgi:phage minor structural protein
MIPILYDKSETAFTSSGLGFLSDCVSCTVTEELNGIFECEFEYPITGPLYPYLTEGNIIFATHDDTKAPQPFDIYSHSAPINGVVTYYAHHISYRLSNIIIGPNTYHNCAAAVGHLGQSTYMSNPFVYTTDIVKSADFTFDNPNSVRSFLTGEDNTLIKTYGGDLEFDKFNVKLLQRRGRDTDVEIRYGKNLQDITDNIDVSQSYNAIVPYWRRSDGTPLLIDTRYVYHDDGSGVIKAVALSMNDYFSTQPTKQAMEDKAQEILDTSYSWLPSREIEVDFVALWQLDEYKDFAPLERVNLGDTVKVFYPAIGVNAIQERVVKTVYNTLLDRYDEITLNQLPDSFGGIISETTTSEIKVSATDLISVVNAGIQLVQGKSGGNIYTETDANGKPLAFYFMDTADTSTAVNVIKLDENGFSYSTTGINGPYSALITMSAGAVTINGDLTVTGTIIN